MLSGVAQLEIRRRGFFAFAMARPAVVLALIIAAGITLRLLFAPSLSGNDDISLAQSALALLDHGIHVPTYHYYARFGLTIPLAFLFWVAGVGIPQLDFLPIVASIAGMMLAWRLGCLLFDSAVGIAAAAALALFPMDIEYASLFFPDSTQGALLAAAVLCALLARSRGASWAVLAGALWAWAYYVKVDAIFLAPVLLLATVLGYVRVQHLVIMGLFALVLVSIEFVAYGLLAGRPFLHMALEHAAANEILAAGHDYRNILTYPRAMFIVPYEAGLHYYAMVAALLLAAATRSRPAALLAGWVLIWLTWLMFGMDPIDGTFRLKPQLPRYLMSFAIPTAVLVGWFGVWLWRRSRVLGAGLMAGIIALAALFAPLNQLSFEPGYATRVALAHAIRERWLPLYPDAQSLHIIRFLLHNDDALTSEVHVVQHHDFLAGVTRFEPISSAPAYLLINQDYARILAQRSLVRPIDPASFGLRPTKVMQVDNPLPAVDYAVLRLMASAARMLPATVRDHIRQTAAEVMRPADAEVYRLDPP